jgi:hypothetical protein
MDIVINSQSVWYGQKQSIRFLYRFVLSQFFDELIGFSCIALSEDRPSISFYVTKAIGSFSLPKVISVLLINQCKNGAAYRNPWFTLVPGFFPGFLIQPDLFCLLDMERFAAFVKFQSRTLQVHAVFSQTAVALEPAPHQKRSHNPSECGSRRNKPGGLGNIGLGLGWANPSPFNLSRNSKAFYRPMSASVSPSVGL